MSLIFFVGLLGLSCVKPLPAFCHQADSLYEKAVTSANQGNLEQARDLLDKAIKDFPAFSKAHHLYGLVNYQLSHQSEFAVTALQKAISLNPHFVQARYDLALFFIQQKHIKEAQEQLETALQSYPKYWEAQLLLGKLHQQHSASGKAIAAFQGVLEQQPTQPDALLYLAYEYHQGNDQAQAQALLSRLTLAYPDHAEGWYLTGRLAEQHNQDEKAKEAYHHVIRLNPEHREAHYSLGFLFQQTGDHEKAIHHFRIVTQLDSNDGDPFFTLGALLAIEGKLHQAKAAYDQGIALQPDSVEGHFNVGTFYEFHMKDLELAKHHYRRYIDLGGPDSRIHTLLQQLDE